MSISERNDKSNDAARARRLEIFTGAGRRRSWTAEQKAGIVAESFEDGAPVSHAISLKRSRAARIAERGRHRSRQ